ncbi:colicin-like bacteriocin tRNase domain-containing protein [Proteus terrae]|uniref:colicin-like bacteriocin tRNase domain-containing protein n=1 Tax=Proteus terrae TaxID=1574161 RepID=UPI000D69691A|nr:colicin-like bacteriocin tRNase domain-containing protein [Proteus terrae]
MSDNEDRDIRIEITDGVSSHDYYDYDEDDNSNYTDNDNEDRDRNERERDIQDASDIDLNQYPEKLVMASAGLPALGFLTYQGVLSFRSSPFVSANIKSVFSKSLTALKASTLEAISVAPKLARVTGVGIAIEGVWPSSNIMSTQAEMALLEKYGVLDRDIFDRNKARKVTTMPADIVTNQISNIGKKTSLSIHTQVMSALDKNTGKQRTIVSTGQAISIPIVKATATNTPNVYTAPIIAGAKPVRISVSENKADKNKQVVINSKPNVGYYIPSSKLKTHHAIVDFGGKHEALYVSIIDVIDINNEKQIVEKEWAEWSTLYPLEAALLELEEAKKRLANIDKQYHAQVAVINKLKATPEGLALADPVKNPLIYKMDGKEYKDVKFDDPELLKAILNKEENFASIISLKYKNQFKGAKLFEVVVILSFLGDSILKTHAQIEDAKKKLAPILESRKKAEEKKKAAEDKVEDIEKKLGAYGEVNTKGKSSGREFNKDKAGGPIKDLDWKDVKIDRDGVDKVKLHTERFGESADNKEMIDRLEKILRGEIKATDIDKRFYTHEIRELERYRNLGIKDGEVPNNIDEVWNNTHTETLEDYNINERTQPLYTPEAIEAYDKSQEIR